MIRAAKKSVPMLVCFMLALFICATVSQGAQIPASAYAEIGAALKEKIAASPYFTEGTEEEPAEYEEKLSAMDFRFPLPEYYQTGVNGIQLDGTHIYFAPVNQYENRAEWLRYSVPERVRLSQIPVEKIQSMTTDELLISCLNYNLLIDMAFADTAAGGYETVKKEFSALEALLGRPDAGTRMLVLYKMIDVCEMMEQDPCCGLRLRLLESLLTEECVVRSLTDSEVKELVQAAVQKAEQILGTKGAILSYSGSASVILKCLYQRDLTVRKLINQSDGLKLYVTGGSSFADAEIDDETLGRIYSRIEQNYLQ